MNLHHPVLRPSLAQTEPELDPAGLRRAADTFFPHGIGVADTALGRLKREFYAGADLAGRGELWGDADSVSLRRSLEDGIKAFLRRAGRPPKRLIVIGCGEGRLLGTIVAVAAAYGVAEIVLNDQFGFHLAYARDLATRLDLAQRGLRLTFVEGDFAEVGGDLRGDLGLAWFFVLPEIVSAVSPAALRAKRDRFFAAVARCLGRHGVLIADRPDVSVGFYHRLQEASRTILAERGLMPGEEANVSLSFIPGLGASSPAISATCRAMRRRWPR